METPESLRQLGDKLLGDALTGALAGIWAGPAERRMYKQAVKKARIEKERLYAKADALEAQTTTESLNHA